MIVQQKKYNDSQETSFKLPKTGVEVQQPEYSDQTTLTPSHEESSTGSVSKAY